MIMCLLLTLFIIKWVPWSQNVAIQHPATIGCKLVGSTADKEDNSTHQTHNHRQEKSLCFQCGSGTSRTLLCVGDYFSRWILQIRIQHHSLLMTTAHRAEEPWGEEVLTFGSHKASVPSSMATLLIFPVKVLVHLRRDTG